MYAVGWLQRRSHCSWTLLVDAADIFPIVQMDIVEIVSHSSCILKKVSYVCACAYLTLVHQWFFTWCVGRMHLKPDLISNFISCESGPIFLTISYMPCLLSSFSPNTAWLLAGISSVNSQTINHPGWWDKHHRWSAHEYRGLLACRTPDQISFANHHGPL